MVASPRESPSESPSESPWESPWESPLEVRSVGELLQASLSSGGVQSSMPSCSYASVTWELFEPSVLTCSSRGRVVTSSTETYSETGGARLSPLHVRCIDSYSPDNLGPTASCLIFV